MAAQELKAETTRRRARTRLRTLASLLSALPAPLGALLAIVVIVGLAWALLVSPWQSPDETTHFAYAQSLAERFALPGSGKSGLSTDQLQADVAVGASQLAFRSTEIRPDWSKHDESLYLAEAARNPSRSDGGGSNAADSNPPLYYLYADLAYWATYGGNTFDRLYAMRIWGISLLALTVVGTWLLIGEVYGRRRLPQLAGSAVVGLVPMETFISTSVNPDALTITLWTFALWLGARVIRRSATPRDAVALCFVVAAAILAKAVSYALVPAVLLALLIGWSRCKPSERRARGLYCVLAVAGAAAPVLAWIGFARSQGRQAFNTVGSPSGVPARPFNVREFLSYVWQFYLPRLPGMTPDRVTPGLSVYDIWLRQGWGIFGWLEVTLPARIYELLGAFTAVVGLATAGIVATFRDRLRWSLLAFFGVAVVALLFGLHLTEYRSLIAGQGPLLQGRYVLPVIGLFGLAVALILGRLPPRWRAPLCGALLTSMLVLQVLALATVAQRYYT
jgi:4-amino-4-deoxy-L-arabinose transferase-like glycosyltransferase